MCLWVRACVCVCVGACVRVCVCASVGNALTTSSLLPSPSSPFSGPPPHFHPQRPTHLRRLRADLQQSRHVAPLFDTVRAVRNLEIALRLMWEAHAAGAEGGGGRERPHLVSGDGGPVSAAAGGGSAGRAAGAERDALEHRLFSMRVETAHAEKV